MDLYLDVFFDDDVDEAFARRAADDLVAEVGLLSPHVTLNVEVQSATEVLPWNEVNWQGSFFSAFMHEPSLTGHQSLLITNRDLGAEGWGKPGYAVVSIQKMVEKERCGGYPVDIVIHEWIHTLFGIEINGHAVPFVDDAEKQGYTPEEGPDGQCRWSAWYRYCLGARDPG